MVKKPEVNTAGIKGTVIKEAVIRGAVFDADGTLLDSMPMWQELGQRYLHLKGIEAEEGLGEILFPMTMEEAAGYLKDRYGLPDSVPLIVEETKAMIRQFYRDQVMPKPGVPEFLQALYNAGVIMSIATSSDRAAIESSLDRLGLTGYFTAIYTCSEIGAGKDRPDIYDMARLAMGTEKTVTWVFEDAVHAARTAADAGYPVAGVYDEASSGCQEELKSVSAAYLKDFKDFMS